MPRPRSAEQRIRDEHAALLEMERHGFTVPSNSALEARVAHLEAQVAELHLRLLPPRRKLRAIAGGRIEE